MSQADQTVAVYIVTYRRHDMLKRSIDSVLRQTHKNIVLNVVNDDPDDQDVGWIVDSFSDTRAKLFLPMEKRGATANFNLVFKECEAPFSALLEDDNWWEPTFLESQLAVLEQFPNAPIVVGNEHIWKELPNNQWESTGRTIWSFDDVRMHEVTLESLCGGAKLCNSSMLVRTAQAAKLQTPDFIPVDVTEHYRERLMPTMFPLNGAPLTNFAETITTARGTGRLWGLQQVALIASIFVALPTMVGRTALARSLWREVDSPMSPRATTLVGAGLAFTEARALVSSAPPVALARSAVGFARRPGRIVDITKARQEMAREVEFLASTPLVKELVRNYL
jgi:hypothetical protein